MKLLAIDTSGKSGSIALMENGRLLRELETTDVGTHSEWLFKNISELLKSLSINPKDIDAYAIAGGPGSFTGLRIGISALKGLAWANKKDVFMVSTLEALAMNVTQGDDFICPVLDARKNEVYSALFKRNSDGSLTRLMPDKAIGVGDLIAEINKQGVAKTVFIGSGLAVYEKDIARQFPGAMFTAVDTHNPRAYNIALLALAGNATRYKAKDLAPIYLRKSEAELKSSNIA